MTIETLGAAMRQISHLFGGGTVTGLSDGQLLDRFLADRDASAFEALVGRHGPMVLSVCRGILRDWADAEDAYQATFLILVKKAHTIRGGQALGGWLYQVAHRVAIQANVVAARRRAHEREAGQMAAASAGWPAGRDDRPTVPDDLLPALHQEIARLPEKYRLPIVLCDLQGKPQAEAAGELSWSERTLRRRLAEARDRLRGRLARRGLAPDGAVLSAVFLNEARAAVPPAWDAAVVRAAMDAAHPAAAAGVVSAAAQSLTHEVLKTMLVLKLTIASAALMGAGIMTWVASAALASRGDGPPQAARAAVGRPATPAPRPEPDPTGRRTEPPPTQESDPTRSAVGGGSVPRPGPLRRDPTAEPDPLDAVGTFPVRGRVLDPDGKPVARAEVFIRHRTQFGWDPADPAPKGQNGRVATSDADGRFRFELDKASSDWPWNDEPAWHQAKIAAVAPGLAMAWVDAGSLVDGREATLRLVRDDVPIRGRVVDPQGRPVAGATVRLEQIGAVKEGTDLDALLASGELGYEHVAAWYGGYYDAIWPGGPNTWTTDADGRFEIKGLGRDRIGDLEVTGPMLAKTTFRVMARPSRVRPKARPRPARRDRDMMFMGQPPVPLLFGATFEHVVGPTKPIEGVVRSKATGQPVGGIKVSGLEGATWTFVSAVTDAQGRFRLVGLPKGEVYQVTANEGHGGVAPYLRAQVTVTDTEGLKPIETALELPRGVAITARLIDPATGRPVRPGQVTYVALPTNPNQGGNSEAPRSLTDPTLRLTVPPGEGMLMIQAKGKDLPYVRARLRKADKGKGVGGVGDGETTMVMMNAHHAYKIIDVPADAESLHVDLELTRGLARKGRVVDPGGKPVAGVQCYGLSPTWGDLRTLADGTFEVSGFEPDHPRQLIFAHKDRRLVGSVIIRGEEARSNAPLVVRLDRPGSIKGRLVDEDGLPVSGATLGTMTINIDRDNLPPGPGPQAMWPDSETVTTGADGRFQIDGLKPGVTTYHGVTFKDRPGYWGDTGKALRDIVIQRPGEVRDLGDITVKAVRQ